MRRSIIHAILALGVLYAVCAGIASAHPSSGIVVDRKGQVFFQDFVGAAIWKIDEQGRLTNLRIPS